MKERINNLANILNRFISGIIMKSVTESVLQDARFAGKFDRELFLFFQEIFGKMKFSQMADETSKIIKPLNLEVSAGFTVVSNFIENVVSKLSKELAGILLLLLVTKTDIKEKVMVQLSVMDSGMINLALVKDLINQSITANNVKSEDEKVGLVADKKDADSKTSTTRCFGCLKIGQVVANCSKLKAALNSGQDADKKW